MAVGKVLLLVGGAAACTTILVGRGASSDGSTFSTHSNDAFDPLMDPRLVRVPAREHAAGAVRPVFFTPENYPRYNTRERDLPAYYPTEANPVASAPIGELVQVARTFAYFEGTYGALNEKQVGIGESTCGCISWTPLGGKPTPPCSSNATGGACSMLSIDELSELAMERASTAREAVVLMGALAVEHGFYGADSVEGSGESLMVNDPNDAYVFHVLPHPSGASAVWAAERIPDDHVSVVANAYVIRSVNLTDARRFLGSDLAAVAKTHPSLERTCASNENCDFTRTFGAGEYAHKYYSGRRMWTTLRHLAPDTVLDPEYPTTTPQWIPYAASYPAKNVSLAALFAAHRDHYEGTPYDLTLGPAAGPFATPTRWSQPPDFTSVKGNWERAVSIHRTSHSHVAQARRDMPDAVGGVLWWGPHVPHATVYTPFAAGQAEVPPSFSSGITQKYEPSTMYWRVKSVFNLMELKFSYMRRDVEAEQVRLEAAAETAVAAAAAAYGKTPSPAALTDALLAVAAKNAAAYRDLFDHLLWKYADGWVYPNAVGYPDQWLVDVGYENGPPSIPYAAASS